MADDIDLSFDKDLIPVLKATVAVIERRTAETEKERSVRLQLFGNSANLRKVHDRDKLLQAVELADGREALRAAVANLPASMQSAEVKELRRWTNSLQRGQIVPNRVRETARSARSQLADERTSLEADRTQLQAEQAKATKTSRAERKPLLDAVAELKKSLSAAEVKKLKDRHAAAKSSLDEAENVLRNWSSATEGWKKSQRENIAKKAVALAAADPDLVLRDRVRSVVDKLPIAADERTLLGGIADEVSVGVLDRSAAVRRKALVDGLPELQRGGGAISRTVNVSAGAELGVVGLPIGTKATLGYSYTVALSRTGDGRYQATITHKGSVGASTTVGDKKVAQANVGAEASLARANSWTYGTLEDLAADVETRLVKMTVGVGRGDAKSAQSLEKQRRALLNTTAANRYRLADHMNRQQVTKDLGDRANAPLQTRSIEHIERVRSVNLIGQLGISAGGVLGDLDADAAAGDTGKGKFEMVGAVAVKAIRTRQFKEVSYLDSVLGNPLEQDLEAASSGGLARQTDHGTESHKAAKVYYDQLRRKAEAADLAFADGEDSGPADEEAADVRNQVRSDMERLGAEYGLFVQLRQHHTAPGRKVAGVEALYRQLLADRGIDGKNKTARYLKAVMLQYATLRDIYETAGSRREDDSVFRQQMQGFEEALRTPQIELSEDERRAAFGREAATAGEVTVVTTASISASYGGGGKVAADRTAGSVTDTLASFGGVSGNLAASFSYSTRPGHPNSSSLGIVADFSTSLLSGGGGRATKVEDKLTEKLAGDLAAKLLDREALRRLTGNQGGHEAVVAELKDAIIETAKGGSGRLEIQLAPVDGKWRLKSVAATERSTTGMSLSGSIPVGPANVVLSVGVHQMKKRVKAVYLSPHTLDGLTNLHRLRRPPGVDPATDRDVMRVEARKRLQSLAASSDGKVTADDGDLIAVLTKLKDGKLDQNIARTWKLKGPSVANELIPWLINLRKDGPAGAKAADEFVDAYLRNKDALAPLPSGTSANSAAARAQRSALAVMEGLFDGVVAAQRDSEDREAASGYTVRRDLSRRDVNHVVADRLADKFFELDLRLHEKLNPGAVVDEPPWDWADSGSKSMVDLRRRLADARRKNPADQELIDLTVDAMSLDHAIEKLDDMNRWGTEAGKDAALASVAKLAKDVFTNQKVYISPDVDGVIIRDKRGRVRLDDDGNFKVRRVVSANKAGLLTESENERNREKARSRFSSEGVELDIRPHIAVDLGPDKKRYWSKRYEDPKRRNAMIAQRRVDGRFLTRGRAAKDDKGSSRLADSFEKLIEYEAKRRRLRELYKRRRRIQQMKDIDDD